MLTTHRQALRQNRYAIEAVPPLVHAGTPENEILALLEPKSQPSKKAATTAGAAAGATPSRSKPTPGSDAHAAGSSAHASATAQLTSGLAQQQFNRGNVQQQVRRTGENTDYMLSFM